jgi:hypothetical protein
MLTGKAEQKLKRKYFEKFMEERRTDHEIKSWNNGWEIPAKAEARRKKCKR